MSFILTIAKLLSPDFFKRAKEFNAIQLLTISISHYCELATWSLKLGKKPFEEHGYAPGQHVLPTLAARIGTKGKKYLSSSSRVTTEGEDASNRKKDASVRATAVPFAIDPSGKVYLDSWEIADASGLPAVDADTKQVLDFELGPLARQLAYSFVMKPANRALWVKLCTEGKHWFWRLMWSVYMGDFVTKAVIKTYQPFNTQAISDCRKNLDVAVAKLERMLANKKGKYFGGSTPGVADVALAALFAPLVNPPQYAGGQFAHLFAQIHQQDKDARDEAERWRKTPLGQFTMKMYEDHRL